MMIKRSRVNLKRHLWGKCCAARPAQLQWEAFVYTPAANSAPSWFFPPFCVVEEQLFSQNYKGQGVFHVTSSAERSSFLQERKKKKKINEQSAVPQYQRWEGPQAGGCPTSPGSRMWPVSIALNRGDAIRADTCLLQSGRPSPAGRVGSRAGREPQPHLCWLLNFILPLFA